ncbi:MAG: hypothetical protein AAGD38_02225 [Acidobacteriota bacterium]
MSVDISHVLFYAAAFDPRQRDVPESMAAVRDDVHALFRLLDERRVRYVLVGGIALLQWVPGRNTEDLDVLLDADALERLPEFAVEARNEEFARTRFRGLQVDLLLTRQPFFAEVRDAYAQTVEISGRNVSCATPTGLVLLKLFALPSLYRQGDFARVGLYENDIATLAQVHKVDLDASLVVLRPHLSETDLREVQNIIDDIRDRITRFERRQS